MAVQNDQLFDPEVQHSLVKKIPNKSTKTKARASLPDILYLKLVEGRVGIFTKGPLPQATQFGPLEAPLATKNQMDEPTFLMKLDIRKCRRLESSASSYVYYDTTDENMCNWMILVQPAKLFPEQNLCAYQNEDFVYFTTTREIQADEELKVWYSPTYAKFMTAQVLTPTSGQVSVPKVNPGRLKSKKSKSTRRMQVYPNSLVLERDVRSIPPKKRGWKRTKRMDIEIPKMPITPPIPNKTPPEKVVKKKLTCSQCDKSFKDKTKLRIHSVVHSGLRNFLCHHCGATFKRKDKLRDHVMRLHEKTKEQPKRPPSKSSENLSKYEFKCENCQIGFHRRGMLINHLQKRHPDTQTENMEQLNRPLYRLVRQFQCLYCTKVYKSNTKRKLHVMKHHPDKPVPCSLKRKRCDGTGIGDDKIITERSIKANPFKCPHCTMQYSMKHKRDKHIKEKHPLDYKKTEKRPPIKKTPMTDGEVDNQSKSVTVLAAANEQNVDHQGNRGIYEEVVSHANEDILSPPTDNLNLQSQTGGDTSSATVSLHDKTNQVITWGSGQVLNGTPAMNPRTDNSSILPVSNNDVAGRLNMSSSTVSTPFASSQTELVALPVLRPVPSYASYEVRFPDNEQPVLSHLYSSTPHAANDVFACRQGVSQSTSNGNSSPDPLSPDLQQLEPAQPNSAPEQPQQHFNQAGTTRSETSSRYPLGRKQILRTYEDSQNQLLQLQNASASHAQESAKDVPRKVQVHSTGRQSNYANAYNTNAIIELRQEGTENETHFTTTSNQRSLCIVRAGTTLYPMLVDVARPTTINSEWPYNDDVTDLNTVNRNYFYTLPESEGT